MMQRIDANIEQVRRSPKWRSSNPLTPSSSRQASSNVSNAQAQLLKYLQGISGNRWLIVKIFMVLVVFIILFVVFFV